MLKADSHPADIGSAEFFDRARARLRFDIPPGLNDGPLGERPASVGQVDPLARPQPANRGGVAPLVTDEGHHILDCALPAASDPALLGDAVKAVTGVVEHGLFLTQASAALLGAPDGSLERLVRP